MTPNVFFDSTFFGPTFFFGHNIFWTQNLFWTKHFFYPKVVGPKMHLKIEFDSGIGPTCSSLFSDMGFQLPVLTVT